MLQKFRSIIYAILGLSLIIIVHELGHFLMCKLFDVKTPVFSVGFGPVLFSYPIGDTSFQLAALPLGGYVAIDTASLATKTYLQKLLINVAGIAFNIIFALFLLIYLAWLAEKKKTVNTSPSLFIVLYDGIALTYQLLIKIAHAMFGAWRPKERSEVMGPIGILTSTTAQESSNLPFMIWWLALINLNVAIFNILPIPLLDGGHIALDTIEALYGKPLPPPIIQNINLIFLLLFLGLLFVISMRDIRRLKIKKSEEE